MVKVLTRVWKPCCRAQEMVNLDMFLSIFSPDLISYFPVVMINSAAGGHLSLTCQYMSISQHAFPPYIVSRNIDRTR